MIHPRWRFRYPHPIGQEQLSSEATAFQNRFRAVAAPAKALQVLHVQRLAALLDRYDMIYHCCGRQPVLPRAFLTHGIEGELLLSQASPPSGGIEAAGCLVPLLRVVFMIDLLPMLVAVRLLAQCAAPGIPAGRLWLLRHTIPLFLKHFTMRSLAQKRPPSFFLGGRSEILDFVSIKISHIHTVFLCCLLLSFGNFDIF